MAIDLKNVAKIVGIGAAGIGALGTLASGIGSFFGGSGGVSKYDTSEIMKFQNRMQQRYDKWYLNNITKATALNEYPWKRQSLESAGFNPVLAYMSPNVSTPSAGSVPSAPVQKESRAQALVGAMSGFMNLRQQGAAIENMNANTALQTEQTRTETFKQVNLSVDSELKRIHTELSKGDLRWQEKEKLLNYQKNLTEMKAMMINAYANKVTANASTVSANANMINAKTNQQWTPAKIGAGIGAGIIGGVASVYGPAKFKALKMLGKIRKVGF